MLCAVDVLAEKYEEIVHTNINSVENPEISRKNYYRHSFIQKIYFGLDKTLHDL